MFDETKFKKDGNIFLFIGDVLELPLCKGCKEGSNNHVLLTQEHPYKMINSEEIIKKEGE